MKTIKRKSLLSLKTKELDKDNVYFIPLGGSEQFGINFNIYGYDRNWLAIDCGVWFPDHRYPMVDLLIPNPEFLEKRKEGLAGIIITHAHEDHIGALPYLWKYLGAPIYCTEFTANFLKKKFEDISPSCNPDIIIVAPDETIDIGSFKVHFIPVAHSIPNAVSVVLETSIGKIYHSSDWNFDNEPVLGEYTDKKRIAGIVDDGVVAYIGDSTNATVEGRSGSESIARDGLKNLFYELEGKIIITLFASNISRIYSVCKIAEELGKSVCLIGRSLHRMSGCAFESGYLKDIKPFVSEEEAIDIPDDKMIYIVTGSQGEARAALSRIARGDYKNLKINKGDNVVYSSRLIPGNEKDIIEVQNNISAAGANIITPKNCGYVIHVSGHPYRDEIKEMYELVKPDAVVAVHGERMMLEAQGELATKCGIDNVIVPCNGSVVRISAKETKIIDHVETGVLAVEPRRIIEADHRSISQRRKLQYSGVAHVSVLVSENGDIIGHPKISSIGLFDNDFDDIEEFSNDMIEKIESLFMDFTIDEKLCDDFLSEEIRIIVRRFLTDVFGFKPIVTVHVMRA